MDSITPATLDSGLHKQQQQELIMKIDDLKESLTSDMEKLYDALEKICNSVTSKNKNEEKQKLTDVKSVEDAKKFQDIPVAGSILLHHDFENLIKLLTTKLGGNALFGSVAPQGGKGNIKTEEVTLNFTSNLGPTGEQIKSIYAAISSVGDYSIKIKKDKKTIFNAADVIDTLIKRFNSIDELKIDGNNFKQFAEAIPILFDSLTEVGVKSVIINLFRKPILSTIGEDGVLTKFVTGLNENILSQDLDNKKLNSLGEAFVSFGKGIKALLFPVLILPLLYVPLLLTTKFIMPLLGKFVEAYSKISEHSVKETRTITKSTISFALLGTALVTAGVAVFLAFKMGEFIVPAIKNVVKFTGFIAAVILLGAIAGLAKWGIIALGVASVLMASSFLLFALSLKILNSIDKEFNFKRIIQTGLSMLTFVGVMALVGLAAGIATISMAGFLVFSLVSLISLGAFWVTLKLFQAIDKLLATVKLEETLGKIADFVKAFAKEVVSFSLGSVAAIAFASFAVSLAIGTLFFIGAILLFKVINKIGIENVDGALNIITSVISKFADSSMIATFALGLVVSIEFAAFSIFFAVGLGLFAISLLELKAINALSENTSGGVEVINNIVESFATKENAKIFGLGIAIGAELLVFSVIFAAGLGLFLTSMLALKGVLDVTKKLKDSKVSFEDIYSNSTGALYTLTTGENKSSIKGTDLLEATKNCGKLAILAIEMAAYTTPMAGAFIAMVSVFDSLIKLQEASDKIGGKENVDNLLGSVGIIFKSMSESVESFKGMSAKAINAIGSLVKDVAESVGMLADTMIKIKDGIKEEEIEGATNKIKLMCENLFGDGVNDGDNFTLTKLFKTLSNSSLKKLRKDSTEALVPLTESISLMGDVIIKFADDKLFSEEKITLGTQNFERISKIFSYFGDLCKGLTKGGSSKFAQFIGNESALSSLNNIIKDNFFGSVDEVVKGFNMAGESLTGLDTSQYSNVIEYFSGNSQFFKEWVGSSANFSTSIKNIQNGLSQMKQGSVDTFNSFLKNLASSGSSISVAVKSLIEFANKASAFGSIATSFKTMSDSLEKISKNKKGFLDIMKSTESSSTNTSSNLAQNSNNRDFEKIRKELEDVKNILLSFVPQSNQSIAPYKGIGIAVEEEPKKEEKTEDPAKKNNIVPNS